MRQRWRAWTAAGLVVVVVGDRAARPRPRQLPAVDVPDVLRRHRPDPVDRHRRGRARPTGRSCGSARRDRRHDGREPGRQRRVSPPSPAAGPPSCAPRSRRGSRGGRRRRRRGRDRALRRRRMVQRRSHARGARSCTPSARWRRDLTDTRVQRRSLRERVEPWLLAPAPPTRLATLRMLIGGYCVIRLISTGPSLLEIARLPAQQFAPVGLLSWLPGPLAPGAGGGRPRAGGAVRRGVRPRWRWRVTGPAFAMLFFLLVELPGLVGPRQPRRSPTGVPAAAVRVRAGRRRLVGRSWRRRAAGEAARRRPIHATAGRCGSWR